MDRDDGFRRGFATVGLNDVESKLHFCDNKSLSPKSFNSHINSVKCTAAKGYGVTGFHAGELALQK